MESSFRAALQGVRNLAAAGVRPQVIMSLMRRNKKQVERVVRLAEDLGASSVKFNIVQPTARGRNLHQTGEALSIGELVELGAWVENELSQRTPLPLVFSHPAAFRPLSKMIGRHECTGVCGVTGILGVLADGSYALCGIGKSVPELVFGHVERDRLEDIWRNDPHLEGDPRGNATPAPRRLRSLPDERAVSRQLPGAELLCDEKSVVGLLVLRRGARNGTVSGEQGDTARSLSGEGRSAADPRP